MSLASHTTSLLRSPTTHGGPSTALIHAPATRPLARSTTSVFQSWKPVTPSYSLHRNAISRHRTEVVSALSSLLRCNAISKHNTQDEVPSGLPVIKWEEIVENADTIKDTDHNKDQVSNKIRHLVKSIRSMLSSMDDGLSTLSPYDTAWVALVEDIGGSGAPQFPSSLDWIANNQLDDGSWGDAYFSAHDRIFNTLACVVALRSWNMHPDKSDRGISFIRANIDKLEDENEAHMPIGFEVALPSLIEIAKKLGIDVQDDSPGLQRIYAKRDLKLKRIPWHIMHEVPTPLLFSLEGMAGLDWEKLLKLQSANGSMLFSPSSTAYALQHTKDENCLKYLTYIVHKFNGGAPNAYPVDLFERNWAVDRLQRLGISRYFQPEIVECMDYVHRYWTPKGICWTRNTTIEDIDDTSMGFRLLRLHGYEVSGDAFKQFEKDGDFICIAGQSTHAVTGMYNLHRASQLMFPGENLLAAAKKSSAKFLQEKRVKNELFDKWIIAKDLPGEVGYSLDVPWYANLPRVETRFYLEQYGGDDDVWIGKTMYRMPKVNSNTYLELAKIDYSNCQALHQMEWKSILKWYKNCNLEQFGLSERRLLQAYYIAAASVFEPERSEERLAWAKTTILLETIVSHFDRQQLSCEHKRAFGDEFEHNSGLNYANIGRYKTSNKLVVILLRTLNQLSLDMLMAHDKDILQQLYHAWQKWIRTSEKGNEREGVAELLVRTLNLNSDENDVAHCITNDQLLSHNKYQQLLEITNRVCHQLHQQQKVRDINGGTATTGGIITVQIESDMQELLKLVLSKSSNDLSCRTKQNFLAVAKSFYYAAYFDQGTIDFHMDKVLFEGVL